MVIPSHLEWKQLGDPIGSGGQGTVYRVVRESDLENIRALKILSSDASPQARERFRNEMETLSSVSHPAIIEVIEYSKPEDDFQYLVMEYHKGAKTIEEVCFVAPESNPYHGNVLKCLDLFEQVIQAIRACEMAKKPVIHRDISPRNILVLPDESIRLIDFGLCHTLDNNIVTMTGENVGTRSYAPPECGAFSLYKTGTHTDIFSAAKVLWSAITSKRVFDSPVIGENTSMKSMFPDKEETWHLRRLFGKIIQENPADRIGRTEVVQFHIDEIRDAVKGGYPPVEKASSRCPSCGLRTMKTSSNANHLFGKFTSGKYFMSECKECEFVVIRKFTPPY